jgi:hypothetical protein
LDILILNIIERRQVMGRDQVVCRHPPHRRSMNFLVEK